MFAVFLERYYLLQERHPRAFLKTTFALFFAVIDGTGGFNNGTKSWNLAIPLTQITHELKVHIN
jgi:hypothetical protein